MSAIVWAYPWDLLEEGVARAKTVTARIGDIVAPVSARCGGPGLRHARLSWLSEAAQAFRS